MGELVSDTESLFDYDIQGNIQIDTILENAREALLIRNMQAFRQVETLQYHTVVLESQYENLEQSSRVDCLTGAYNRFYLDEIIQTAFQSASTNSSPLSFIFFDLDNFKNVNDTHGHQIGDEILKIVAKILKEQVRSTDTIGRYGGDEFVIVMPGVNSTVAETICNRIVLTFREKTHDVKRSQNIKVTVSLGMASLEDGQEFETADEMIRAADQALYASKSQGRDRWTSYKTVRPQPTP